MLPETMTIEAVGAALVAFMLFMARTAVRFARSPEGRVILRVLRKHGVRAAANAHAEFVHQVKGAHAADSEGGVAVTPSERTRIARATARAFIHSLDVAGMLEAVVVAFGGQEKLEAELVRRIEEKMDARLGG